MVGIDPYDRVKQREAQQRKQLLLEQQQQRAAQQQQQRAQQQQLGNQDALLSLVRVHRRVQVLHMYVLILLSVPSSVPSLFPVQVNLSPSAPTVSGDLLLRRENDQMKDELRQANMVFREKNRRLDSIVSFHRCCLSCLVQQSCTAILCSNRVQQSCTANTCVLPSGTYNTDGNSFACSGYFYVEIVLGESGGGGSGGVGTSKHGGAVAGTIGGV